MAFVKSVNEYNVEHVGIFIYKFGGFFGCKSRRLHVLCKRMNGKHCFRGSVVPTRLIEHFDLFLAALRSSG